MMEKSLFRVWIGNQKTNSNDYYMFTFSEVVRRFFGKYEILDYDDTDKNGMIKISKNGMIIGYIKMFYNKY